MKSTLLLLPLAAVAMMMSCKNEEIPALEVKKNVPVESVTKAPVKVAVIAPTTKAELDMALKADNPDYQNTSKVQEGQGGIEIVVLARAQVTNISALSGMKLKAIDLSGTAVDDISPLAGMALQQLFLENTPIKDIQALKGMPLQKLYLSQTAITDISALSGMPLTELNLVGARVSNISALRGMSTLKSLWLSECPIADITPLAGTSLESLTLHRTNVTDLTPLKGTSIQRLHIAETPVTDVTPILNIPLKRFIFTPKNITKGINELKTIPTLGQLGTYFDERGKGAMAASVFWQLQESQKK